MKIITLKIYVQPGAKQSEIVGMHAESIKIRIKNRALEGKANEELISFLSLVLDIKKSAISIVRGKRSRLKEVEISVDESCQQLEEKIRDALDRH